MAGAQSETPMTSPLKTSNWGRIMMCLLFRRARLFKLRTERDYTAGTGRSRRQWQEWVNSASDISLDHVFQYQNTKKEQFKQPVYQMILHVFNHGTYHRGQIVNMLRQVGVEKIPQTDFIVWSRGKRV